MKKNIWLHTAYWRGMLDPYIVLVIPIAAALAATVVSGKSRNMLHASLILFALHTLFKYVWVEAFSWVYPHGFTWAHLLEDWKWSYFPFCWSATYFSYP
ncbi:MAG TPA: hypothetical protein ENG61_00955 [Candidatus Korarchaeota archaeon]|nr:hypothetical protein [Candidatus Korarchaeota archaeon]